MSQQYVGEIRLMPYNFAPRTWAYCAGQILPIQQNTALFSLLGTTYGGDGRVTFGLPDLRGRCVVGTGTNQGESFPLGALAGAETVTITQAEMPAHNHSWKGSSSTANGLAAASNYFATTVNLGSPTPVMAYGQGAPLVPYNQKTIMPSAGGGQAHNNMQPFQVLAYCIALQGIYPARN